MTWWEKHEDEYRRLYSDWYQWFEYRHGHPFKQACTASGCRVQRAIDNTTMRKIDTVAVRGNLL